jgi:nucleoside-diphosphate-sugar epimerase
MATLLSIVTALVVGGSGIYDFMNPPRVLTLMGDLGYKPATTVRQGVAAFVEWYLAYMAKTAD